MKCEFVNAVIHGLKDTLINLSTDFDKVEIKDVFVKEEMFTRHPVAIKTSFSGGLRGMVVMSMELQTAISLADLLLVSDGSYASGFTDIVQSSLKEVANMFLGEVAMFLAKGRPEINILPPHLSFGTKVKVSIPVCPIPVSILLNVSAGFLEFDVCIAEVAQGAKKEQN